MIDWSLARRVADAVGSAGEEDTPPAALPGDLVAMHARASAGVIAYTQLTPAHELPFAEPVDRRVWARANLATMQETLTPVIEEALTGERQLPGPLRAAAGGLLGAEIGGLVGFMGRHVLGQYELALLDPQRAPRLLLVAPNVTAASRAMDVDAEQLLEWVVFHEITHAVQFDGVPWLRDHLAGLLRELLAGLEVRVDTSALRRLPSAQDLRVLWDRMREGGVVTAVAGPERKAALDRVQATMALIEGHAEHVMDAAGAQALPDLPTLRAALDRRRRERPPLLRLLERLLGLDLKLRQYIVGRRFCDAVVRERGIAGLNRAWTGPEWLPTLTELDDPLGWVARVEARALPPAA